MRFDSPSRPPLTALIPARDEAGCIATTIHSLREQSCPPDHIIVIDDGSTDGTGDIARTLGVRVLRSPGGGGSKAEALNFGLRHVNSELVLTIDADTCLETDAVERLLAAMDHPSIAAASGFVLPLHMRTIWERARYVDYLITCWIDKPIQSDLCALTVVSGCFAVYRTGLLRRCGGWPAGTTAEDMGLTWSLQAAGYTVRHVTGAVCYVIDPDSCQLTIRQLRRWSSGFLQNLRAHWPAILTYPYLRSTVIVTLLSRLLDCALRFVIWPFLAIAFDPLFLLGMFITVPMDAVALLAIGLERGEVWRALSNLPWRIMIQFLRDFVFVQAVWSELIVGRPLTAFEKGH